jgi:hypothetical protein
MKSKLRGGSVQRFKSAAVYRIVCARRTSSAAARARSTAFALMSMPVNERKVNPQRLKIRSTCPSPQPSDSASRGWSAEKNRSRIQSTQYASRLPVIRKLWLRWT